MHLTPNAQFAAALAAAESLEVPAVLRLKNRYRVECYGADGALRWAEEVDNLIPDAGANDLLTHYLAGSGYTASFFVGLVDNAGFTAFANADTAASHAGWSESVAYSQATRPALVLGAAAARSISNSASAAVFSINASATLNGALVITTSNKGGATGVIYGEASFASTRAVQSGDTLNVTITLSA